MRKVPLLTCHVREPLTVRICQFPVTGKINLPQEKPHRVAPINLRFDIVGADIPAFRCAQVLDLKQLVSSTRLTSSPTGKSHQ